MKESRSPPARSADSIDSKESSKAAKQSGDRIKQNVIRINFSGRGGRDCGGRNTI